MRGLLTERDIEEKIIALVARARGRFGIKEGSTGREACEALRLGLRRGPLPIGQDAMLTEDGVVIVNDRTSWMPRIEFSIFHEIMHHLLEEDGELIGYYTETLRDDDHAYHRAIEQCCHAGAAEFLAPRDRIYQSISEYGFSVDLMERIAAHHRLSIMAAAIRLARYAPVDCYTAVCAYGVSPKFWPPDQTLYVDVSAHHPGMRYPWAHFTPIPRDHLFHQAWEAKQRQEGPSYVPFPSGARIECEYAEAKPVGDRVAGILYLGHPPRKGQLDLGLRL